jgi:hypothetical protein
MMKVTGSGYKSEGYDYTQRAYILETKRHGSGLDLEFAASKERPLVNLALVIKNWGRDDVSLRINGKKIPRGKDFRFGIEYDVEGNTTLIVWVKIKADERTRLSLRPVK